MPPQQVWGAVHSHVSDYDAMGLFARAAAQYSNPWCEPPRGVKVRLGAVFRTCSRL